MSPLLLIDGNSLTYRAFFALPTDMATSSGQVTNAVFGFASMLAALLRDHNPSGVAVAFDLPGPTFRHEKLADYKANRERQPDILYEQLDLVRELVMALGLRVADAKGFEADDVIATLATMARDSGRDVLVVTGDRDAYQLVEDPHIRLLYNKRGVSEYVLYDEAGIRDRTGVDPADYVEYAALRGDQSDNLPGVPGVGEKTAARLINAHGDLAGVFASADEQTPKLRENLVGNEARARLNAELMALVRDVPLAVGVSDLERQPVDLERARGLFDLLELTTVRDRLGSALGVEFGSGNGPGAEGPAELEISFTACLDTVEAVSAIDAFATSDGPVAVAAAIGSPAGVVEGLALTDGETTRWVPPSLIGEEEVRRALGALFGTGGPALATHAAKPLVRGLLRMGLDTAGLTLDTTLAGYLLDPSDSSYELSDLLGRYTGLRLPEVGVPDGQLDLDGESRDPAAMACHHAAGVYRLVAPMLEALAEHGLRTLHDEIEMPLVAVLARMEEAGIGVDVEELTRLRNTLTADCERLRASIQDAAGQEFNVNSTKQLREILFEKLELTPGKRTKTGYSTDAATLERLRGEHPVVEHLLNYREVEKLRSTYGEGLLAEVHDDHRIRATFNQTVARTGRLSSDAPNLHNIPVRTELGRAFRRAFIPAPGEILLVADYNQIELRCIAHLSGDPSLIAAFEAGDDIHRSVASRTWGVPTEEVTTELRNRAKMVAYGLAYGMEAYGLAQRLDIPTDEASGILEAYFEAFPGVRDYMDRSVDEARQRGYTETLFGRRRPIPELASNNFNVRQAGERQAMNAPIQGLAADIFKVALVGIDHGLSAAGLASRLVLQVHDEVLLEVEPTELDQVTELVRVTMGGAFDLRVELAVDLATGATWADAKR